MITIIFKRPQKHVSTALIIKSVKKNFSRLNFFFGKEKIAIFVKIGPKMPLFKGLFIIHRQRGWENGDLICMCFGVSNSNLESVCELSPSGLTYGGISVQNKKKATFSRGGQF